MYIETVGGCELQRMIPLTYGMSWEGSEWRMIDVSCWFKLDVDDYDQLEKLLVRKKGQLGPMIS